MSQATEVTGGVGAKGQADWLEVRAGGVGYSLPVPLQDGLPHSQQLNSLKELAICLLDSVSLPQNGASYIYLFLRLFCSSD